MNLTVRAASAAAWRRRALASMQQGRLEHAATELQHALRAATEAGSVEEECLANELLAVVYERAGDAAAALRHYRRYHALYAGNQDGGPAKPSGERDRLPAAHDAPDLRDTVTGLRNRRWLESAAKAGLSWRQFEEPYSVALVGIDGLARLRAEQSASIADDVLRRVAAILVRVCRQGDIAVRYDEECLALVLSKTVKADALIACERIRSAIEHHSWAHLHAQLRVTASIGLAWRGEAATPHAVFAMACRRLEAAQRAGCNAVVAEGNARSD